MKKILTFALRIGSICLVLSDLCYMWNAHGSVIQTNTRVIRKTTTTYPKVIQNTENTGYLDTYRIINRRFTYNRPHVSLIRGWGKIFLAEQLTLTWCPVGNCSCWKVTLVAGAVREKIFKIQSNTGIQNRKYRFGYWIQIELNLNLIRGWGKILFSLTVPAGKSLKLLEL